MCHVCPSLLTPLVSTFFLQIVTVLMNLKALCVDYDLLLVKTVGKMGLVVGSVLCLSSFGTHLG